ncbi:MAG: hypothetical protein ACO1QB_17975, partial [Verrucomicrobiales bacterium]
AATVTALGLGYTFMLGALLNSIFIGGTCYLLIRFLYDKARPSALVYSRRYVQRHQRRFNTHLSEAKASSSHV